MRELLRAGVKPHWWWACEAMRGGHLALAEVLLESGVERNVFTMAAIGDAAGLERRLGRVPTDARTIASMEPHGRPVTALHVGCASDWRPHGPGRMSAQVDVAEILSKGGAELGAVAHDRGFGDATPLFWACWTSGNAAWSDGCSAEDRSPPIETSWLRSAISSVIASRAYDVAEALLTWGLPVDGGVPVAHTIAGVRPSGGPRDSILADRGRRGCQRTRSGRPNGRTFRRRAKYGVADAHRTRRKQSRPRRPG